MEGMGIDHAHIKLYPLYDSLLHFKEMLSKERIFYDNYQGYITTQLGPQASEEELNQTRNLFK